MRSNTALVAIVIASAACAPPERRAPEDFGSAFEQMQASAEFLASRASPQLQITEEFRREQSTSEEIRVIPCGITEVQASGWNLLPGAARLAQTHTAYSSPMPVGTDQMVVTLGPAEGAADARYDFRALNGRWYLARVVIYSYLAPSAVVPPLPCNMGHRPNNSSKPTPLRGAA